MKQKQVIIVHYNTPEMTEAAILSLRRHGGADYHVTIFDNSDSRPFTKQMEGVEIIDNTLGQVIDIDAELRRHPDRSRYMGCSYNGDWNAVTHVFGSARHMITVQWFIDNFKSDFLLMDSDILLQQSPDFMFQPDTCVVGHVQTWLKAHNPMCIDRLAPMLLYINAPLCRERGARMYDPARCYALSAGGRSTRANWYDTGAALLEDIRSHRNDLCGRRIDIRPLMIHYGAGSWHKTNRAAQLDWLEAHRLLWADNETITLGDPEAKHPANRSARIYIAAHADFTPVVSNKVYEVVAPSADDKLMGVDGAFFSELTALHDVASRKRLPAIVGFCQYRKYYHWMDDVPDLAKLIKRYGCVVSANIDLGVSVREHYDRVVGNVADLDLATTIIESTVPEFAAAWRVAINQPTLHPATMFVMSRADFLEMEASIETIVMGYLSAIGGDIDARINAAPEKYHLPRSSYDYQRRVGGQLCERIASAWIDWRFSEAKEVTVRVTSKPILRS